MSKALEKTVPGTAGTPLTPNFTAVDYVKFFSAGALCCTM
jgi:hypothetical protein